MWPSNLLTNSSENIPLYDSIHFFTYNHNVQRKILAIIQKGNLLHFFDNGQLSKISF